MNTYETIDCIDFSTKKKVKEESYCEVKDLSKIQLRIGYNKVKVFFSKKIQTYQEDTNYDWMFAPIRQKNLNLQFLLCDNC